MRERIYIASKAIHGPRWIHARAHGVPIISTWIDEYAPGATKDWTDLWIRSINEVKSATVLVLYQEHGEILKGALVEAGAALASGVPVMYVGPYTHGLLHHPGAAYCKDLVEAFDVGDGVSPEALAWPPTERP